MNKSRKFMAFDFRLLVPMFEAFEPVVAVVVGILSAEDIVVVLETGCGKLIGNVFQWYKNCEATSFMCSINCSTSAGAPTKLI